MRSTLLLLKPNFRKPLSRSQHQRVRDFSFFFFLNSCLIVISAVPPTHASRRSLNAGAITWYTRALINARNYMSLAIAALLSLHASTCLRTIIVAYSYNITHPAPHGRVSLPCRQLIQFSSTRMHNIHCSRTRGRKFTRVWHRY